MPGNDLPLLIEAAQAAGDIAARHFGNGPQSWDKGQGQGPVSEADLEVDEMLRSRLLEARPDYGWLSEETADDGDRLTRQRVFVVDPIDGTRAFLDGQRSFAHALAVVEDGRPVAAVVHLPLMNLTYTATATGGATLNGRVIRVRPRAVPGGARVLASRTQLAPDLWPGGVPEVERHFRPSLAWRLCLVADGSFDGMLTLRPAWEWDIAAAALIAAEAGVHLSDRKGQALRFNAPHPQTDGVIAGPEAVHHDFLQRLGAGRADLTRAL
ncbi:3'(2'),5'-bisphosphate nucleotidase CysQ [Halodurantibacterium flavum]|uniref:3'(2'),5'-bisphosphate nucleotidase CysQ n=1 Tax=Halodurantibacterium flavum TaxID=1382802 RepID=A0ABW4S783_9RHOB